MFLLVCFAVSAVWLMPVSSRFEGAEQLGGISCSPP